MSQKIAIVGSGFLGMTLALRLAEEGNDVTLFCAGTNGLLAMEDILGAGAVINELEQIGEFSADSDAALVASRLFREARNDLPAALGESCGGRNVIAAGLEPDIEFAARLNSLNVVGSISGDPPIVRRWVP